MMNFLLLQDDFGISKEQIPLDPKSQRIYAEIVQYYRMKRDVKRGISVNMEVYNQLKIKKSTYINSYIEKHNLIRKEKRDLLTRILHKLIILLCDYVGFMESLEEDSFMEYFLEYDVHVMIHLFQYVEHVYLYDPALMTLSRN